MPTVTTHISRIVIASSFVLAAITVQGQTWRPPADADRAIHVTGDRELAAPLLGARAVIV